MLLLDRAIKSSTDNTHEEGSTAARRPPGGAHVGHLPRLPSRRDSDRRWNGRSVCLVCKSHVAGMAGRPRPSIHPPAGIAAARNLTDAGLRVVVLEGRDRVGGRLLAAHGLGLGGNAGGTDDATTTAIDLGAMWIHGGHAGNPLYDLAVELGLALSRQQDYTSIAQYDVDGARVAPLQYLDVYQKFGSQVRSWEMKGGSRPSDRHSHVPTADPRPPRPAPPRPASPAPQLPRAINLLRASPESVPDRPLSSLYSDWVRHNGLSGGALRQGNLM